MSDNRIPVTLITGFLGSGKTTLLAAILNRRECGRAAVLVNEYGEVPLDQVLIERRDGPLVVTSGGCLCCVVQGGVVGTLLDLYQRRAQVPFDRVFIEASGLADPCPILAPLIQSTELNTLFRIEGVIAVVDALQGLKELGRERISAQQVAMADRIVLTKTDIGAPHAVARLRAHLAGLNPWAPQSIGDHGQVEPAFILESGGGAVERAFAHRGQSPHHDHGHDHSHSHDLHSFCLWLDGPVSWQRFAAAFTALTQTYGSSVLRLKGLLRLTDTDHPLAAVHGVQHFLHPPVPLAAWPDDDRPRLIFITHGLAAETARPFFEDFPLAAPRDVTRTILTKRGAAETAAPATVQKAAL